MTAINLEQSWQADTARAAAQGGVQGPDLLDRIKTLKAILQLIPTFKPVLLPTGIASISESASLLPATATYLSSLAIQSKEVAFSGGFSSVVAGSSSESDEMVDVPLFIGKVESEGKGLEWIKKVLGIEEGGKMAAESNELTSKPSEPPKILTLLPSSVASHPSHTTLDSLLSELDPESRIEFEVVTSGSKVACFIVGKRQQEWVGLVSCGVFT